MVGEVKPPMSEKNGEKVLNFVLAIVIGPALGGVVIHGGAQAYVTSCDIDRDPVQKTIHDRRVPWKNGVRKCTVDKGAIRLADKRATVQLFQRRSVLESGDDGYN